LTIDHAVAFALRCVVDPRALHSFPTRRSSDLRALWLKGMAVPASIASSTRGLPAYAELRCVSNFTFLRGASRPEELVERAKALRSEEHTSELQSRENLVCRLLLEKKKNNDTNK